MPPTPTRVLLVDMPRIARDIVEQAVAAHPRLALVGVEPDTEPLERRAEETGAEVVIVKLESGDLPQAAHRFLARRARSAVIGVEIDDGTAVLHRLRPDAKRIDEGKPLSPDELVAAIQAAVDGY